MNTSQQIEDLMGAWTNLQRQFWEGCLPTNATSSKSDLKSACKKPLEVTREAMSEMLQTQAKLTRSAMKYADPQFTESGMVDQYFESVQEMIDTGINAEKDMVDSWFDLAKQCEHLAGNPMTQWGNIPQLNMNPMATWNQGFNSLLNAWQDIAEKTLDAQEQLFSGVMQEKKASEASKSRTQRKIPITAAESKHKEAA